MLSHRGKMEGIHFLLPKRLVRSQKSEDDDQSNDSDLHDPLCFILSVPQNWLGSCRLRPSGTRRCLEQREILATRL